MKDSQARATLLRDYRPPAFLVETTELEFDLHESHASVRSRLLLRRNPDHAPVDADDESLVLDGDELVLEELRLDGRVLEAAEYQLDLDGQSLRIPHLGALGADLDGGFELACQTRIEPQNNTALEGLYKSRKMFCTQCEEEGCRRITFYRDRPDVMSKFAVTTRADRARYPVLLANGNCIAEGA